MYTLTLDKGLPWSNSYEEDRRYLRILSTTLAVCLVIGIITPYVEIPQMETEPMAEEPPHRVRLLPETARPTPTPTVIPMPSETAKLQSKKITAEPKQEVSSPTPRTDIASIGVLAMQNKLSKLHTRDSNTSKTFTSAGTNSTQVHIESSQPSKLTENLTKDSGGIQGGVAHQAVLGAASLPDRSVSGQLDLNPGKTEVESETKARPAGQVRSQEDIQETLDLNKGAMYTLYNRELRTNPGLQGKLVLSITIAPQGHVSHCTILNSELNSESLERALISLVKSIHFGDKPESTFVSTKIPIEFFPQ
ncbi:MAG: AgmX/PglI C-terminal domain-containing protein [Halioglobus sp.]